VEGEGALGPAQDGMAGGVTDHKSIARDRVLADVPPSIGPVVFGTLGVGWVMVRCPRQYDELMRGAGGVWEPGARQWLVERRRIGPVIPVRIGFQL